ncbi:hypothetical protein AX16_007349 [Volvariella volvacea WC 439]|nr:hypothetical protein AX16_007349 [Volvariella volvacea WC 439]
MKSSKFPLRVVMFALSYNVARRVALASCRPRWRHLSTKALHPSIQGMASKLSEKQPTFAVVPRQTTILTEPHEFYTLLLDMIKGAQRRIFISSLYIGEGETELISELDNALQANSALTVNLQLDFNRSTRPGPTSTAKLLLPLLQKYPDRVQVSMFRSPSLRGLMAKAVPPRFNEGWGTWHAKIYGVDDQVIISGANLNKSYFTDRQDRYLHFNTHPQLAQYCFDFLGTVSTFSFRLLPSSKSSSQLPPHSFRHEDYVLEWTDPSVHPHNIHAKAHAALSSFQKSHHQSTKSVWEGSSSDSEQVALVPIIQAGQFNIREEEDTLSLLFRELQKQGTISTNFQERPLIDLTSGYFGLYKAYQDLILSSPDVDCRVVVASPQANGFYGSSGISGRIPEGYTLLEKRFMKAVKKAGRMWKGEKNDVGTGVQLSEWNKDGWTYHAKGLWLSPTHEDSPILTLFGSTNLNSRSAHIDTELSFVMLLPSEPTAGHAPSSEVVALRQSLADEVEGIRENAESWHGKDRKVGWLTTLIVALVEGML